MQIMLTTISCISFNFPTQILTHFLSRLQLPRIPSMQQPTARKRRQRRTLDQREIFCSHNPYPAGH